MRPILYALMLIWLLPTGSTLTGGQGYVFIHSSGAPKLGIWAEGGAAYMVEIEGVGEAWIPRNGTYAPVYDLPDENLSGYLAERLVGPDLTPYISSILNATHGALEALNASPVDRRHIMSEVSRIRGLVDRLGSSTALSKVLEGLGRMRRLIAEATSRLSEAHLDRDALREVLTRIAGEAAGMGYIAAHTEEIKRAIMAELNSSSLPHPSIDFGRVGWVAGGARTVDGLGVEEVYNGSVAGGALATSLYIVARAYNGTVVEDYGAARCTCGPGVFLGVTLGGVNWTYSAVRRVMARYGLADIFSPAIVLHVKIYGLRGGGDILLREREAVSILSRSVDAETGATELTVSSGGRPLVIRIPGRTVNLMGGAPTYRGLSVHVSEDYKALSVTIVSRNYGVSQTTYWLCASLSSGNPGHLVRVDPATGLAGRVEGLGHGEGGGEPSYDLPFSLMAVSVIALAAIIVFEKARRA